MTGADAELGLFDSALYSSTIPEKLRRSVTMAPRYYFRDLPAYLIARRGLGLTALDWRAILNPLREFWRRVYTPFELPPGYRESLEVLRGAGMRLAIPRLRLESLLGAWWAARRAKGDVIECGAYEGATSLLIAILGKLNGIDQTVFALDTFQGAPSPSRFDGGHRQGEFHSPRGRPEILESAALAAGVKDRLRVEVGRFSDTFARPRFDRLRFSFAHVDANLFEGTRDSCSFALPRMNPGGIVVFDDYNGVTDLGARLAIDSALGGVRPRPLVWCSAFLPIAG